MKPNSSYKFFGRGAALRITAGVKFNIAAFTHPPPVLNRYFKPYPGRSEKIQPVVQK